MDMGDTMGTRTVQRVRRAGARLWNGVKEVVDWVLGSSWDSVGREAPHAAEEAGGKVREGVHVLTGARQTGESTGMHVHKTEMESGSHTVTQWLAQIAPGGDMWWRDRTDRDGACVGTMVGTMVGELGTSVTAVECPCGVSAWSWDARMPRVCDARLGMRGQLAPG